MADFVQLTIDDTSPSISYSPFRDTLSTPNLSAGWNPYYDLSGFVAAVGETGNGTSLHITSRDGASIAVRWHGTGIRLLGNTTLASYSITLDGTVIAPNTTSSNVLTDIQGLENAPHTITLTAQIPQNQNPPNASMLVFDKAIILSSPVSSNPNASFKPQTLSDNDIAFVGRWSFETAPVGSSFHTSNTEGDRAVTTFNGTTFSMQGITSPEAGDYTVTLDDVTSTLSGRSSFLEYNTTLFFVSGLNASVVHSVEVRNAGGGELSLLVDGFSTSVPFNPSASPSATPPPTGVITAASSNPSFPKGTIAAFVLAGILAFLLLTGSLYFFLVYRPRCRRRRTALNNRLGVGVNGQPRSPKEQEAGVVGLGLGGVLDIAPHSSKDFDLDADLDMDEYAGYARIGRGNANANTAAVGAGAGQRNSGRSGFSRWRREAVDGNFDYSARLPIRFRHSESADEKSPVGVEASGDNDNFGNTFTHGADRDRRSSSGATTDSSTRRAIARAKERSKGKARQVLGRSWSPSFTLDLPGMRDRRQRASGGSDGRQQRSPSSPGVTSFGSGMPTFPAAEPSSEAMRSHQYQNQSQGQNQSQSQSRNPNPNQSQMPPQQGAADHPPSYAASMSLTHSNRGSYRDVDSNPSPSSSAFPDISVPRSVSHSPIYATPTYPRPLPHQRESSRKFLLHGDDGEGSDHEHEHEHGHHQGPPRIRPLPQLPHSPYSRHHQRQGQTSPSESIPMRALGAALGLGLPHHSRDRGSASTDDLSSLRQVIRSLSPRTSVRPSSNASFEHGLGRGHHRRRSSSLGSEAEFITQGLLFPSYSSSADGESPQGVLPGPALGRQPHQPQPPPQRRPLADERPFAMPMPKKPLPRTPTLASDDFKFEDGIELRDGAFLDIRATSPFRVDFDSRSGLNRVSTRRRTATAESGSPGGAVVTTSDGNANPDMQNTARTPEFVQGTSRAPFRLTNITIPVSVTPPKNSNPNSTRSEGNSTSASDGVTSFLDLTSSREGSMRSRSIKTIASDQELFEFGPGAGGSGYLPIPGEPRSRWSNTIVPSVATNPASVGQERRDSSGESSQKAASANGGGGRSEGGAPPSPHHVTESDTTTTTNEPTNLSTTTSPLTSPTTNLSTTQPQQQSRLSAQSNLTQAGDRLHVHPQLEDLESPTESIPMSVAVSELQFRHSDTEDPNSPNANRDSNVESRRSTESSLAFHHALLRLGRTSTQESLNQVAGGAHPGLPGTPGDEYIPRPFDPTILVQVNRVLGLPSPTSTLTVRPGGHSRSASGPVAALFPSNPSSPRPDTNKNMGNDPSNSDISRTHR